MEDTNEQKQRKKEEEASSSSISQFPWIILGLIFRALPIFDRLLVEQVCRWWRDAAKAEAWTKSHAIDFNKVTLGMTPPVPRKASLKSEHISILLERTNIHLRSLDIASFIETDDEYARVKISANICNFLQHVPNLTSLNISNVPLQNPSLSTMGHVLPNLRTLEMKNTLPGTDFETLLYNFCDCHDHLPRSLVKIFAQNYEQGMGDLLAGCTALEELTFGSISWFPREAFDKHLPGTLKKLTIGGAIPQCVLDAIASRCPQLEDLWLDLKERQFDHLFRFALRRATDNDGRSDDDDEAECEHKAKKKKENEPEKDEKKKEKDKDDEEKQQPCSSKSIEKDKDEDDRKESSPSPKILEHRPPERVRLNEFLGKLQSLKSLILGGVDKALVAEDEHEDGLQAIGSLRALKRFGVLSPIDGTLFNDNTVEALVKGCRTLDECILFTTSNDINGQNAGDNGQGDEIGVGEDGLRLLAKLPFLKDLSLDTKKAYVNGALVEIARHGALEKLFMLDCTELTDEAIVEVIRHCKWLSDLLLIGCPKLTDIIFDELNTEMERRNGVSGEGGTTEKSSFFHLVCHRSPTLFNSPKANKAKRSPWIRLYPEQQQQQQDLEEAEAQAVVEELGGAMEEE